MAVFAIAAVPGSLLVARGGARLAVTLGMVIAGFAGGARGAAVDVWTLYAASIATGFGIAIMQPGMPTLVREWLPHRIGLGTVVYSNGMVDRRDIAAGPDHSAHLAAGRRQLAAQFFRLGRAGNSHRAGVFSAESEGTRAVPRRRRPRVGRLWWPDWTNPLIWLLGLTFGCNNSRFFAANAFLGDYLASRGQADLLGPALASLNGAQIVALVVLVSVAGRLQRRAWPFLLFGPVMLAGFLGLILIQSPLGIVVCTAIDRRSAR